MKHRTNATTLLAACVLVASHSLLLSSASAAPPRAQAPAAGMSDSLRERLGAMARIAGANLSDLELADWLDRVRKSEDVGLRQFVDHIVGTDEFLEQTAPGILLGDYANFLNIKPKTWILEKKVEADGRTLWFRDGKPSCKVANAISVRSWWSASDVFICPDDYRPEVRSSEDGTQCSAMNATKGCGCGPNLMRCAPAEAATALAKSQIDEVRDTAAYFIRRRRPIRELFLSNETARNAYAEVLYRRWQVEEGARTEIGALGNEPMKASFRPRVESAPGQHAGILTTQNVMFWESGLRPVMRVMYEMLWCSEPSSTGVDAAAVLDMGAKDVRAGEGWEQLAKRPICTECHARLDYGMQFFHGFLDARKGVFFDPHAARSGLGALYAKNIGDLRGHAALTPQGFAQLAVQQPEFQSCQVKKVVYRVFGAHADPEDFAVVRDAMKTRGDLVSMVTAALNRYGSRSVVADRASNHPAVFVTGIPSNASVRLPDALRAEVDQRCGDCHSTTEPRLDTETLPIATVARMAVNVAFGRMPKNSLLPDAERRALVDRLLGVLPRDHRTSLADLERYYGDGYLSSRARTESDIVDDFRSGLGLAPRATPSRMWGRVPDDVYQLTPGLIATIAVDAIETCKEQESLSQKACLDHILRFEQMRLAR